MEFTITQFYLNPRYKFKFSSIIQGDICTIIEKQILKKSRRLSKTDWAYWVIITAEKKFKKPKVSNADIGKRNRQKTMSLTLPYDQVKNSKESIVEFCALIFESLPEILSQDYEIDQSALQLVKGKFLKKVSGNPNKYYKKET